MLGWMLVAALSAVSNAQISMVSNSHVIGGTQQVGITTLGDCFRACAVDGSCLGLDFNTLQSTCWFHFADTVCANRESKVGCTSFRFTECPLPPFPQGVTSYSNSHVGGGNRQFGIDTVEGCVAVCAQLDGCQGFDFDISDHTCWTHTADSVCGEFREKLFCAHYRLVSCSATTAAPLTAPSIEYAETFNNIHIFGGHFRAQYSSLSSCYQACYSDKSCHGFDWNSIGQCWFHYEDTVCDNLEAKAGCTHYRIRSNCAIPSFGTCSNIGFQEVSNAYRLEGDPISGQTTEDGCQQLCLSRSDCAATTFSVNTFTCYIHTSTGIPIPNDCCTHSVKKCNDVSTTLVPRTVPTTIGETTTPTVVEQTTILDNGKCPAEFLKFESSSHGSGTPVSPAVASTVETCKQYCLDTPGCVAADFNQEVTSGSNCFIHTSIQPLLFKDGTDSCCTHFRRINCEQKECYVHSAIDLQPLISNPEGIINITAFYDVLNIHPNGLFTAPLVDCDGVCFTTTTLTLADGNADLSQPYIMERGCDPLTSEIKKSCFETEDFSGRTRMQCSCYNDECNAYGMTLLQECQAYFPLDCTVEDASPYLRNSDAFIFPNIKFDSLDAQKNWSAVFDGSAYIQIPAFSSFQFGSVGLQPNFVHNPAFTITMWIKRTGGSGRQVILSNGGIGAATVEIVSNDLGSGHSITASFQIRGSVYSATTSSIPLNQWSFIAAMVTPSPLLPPNTVSTGNFYVQVILDDTSSAAAFTDTGISTDPLTTGSLLIDTSTGDLCIGKQYQARSGQRGDFFVGELDEIWFFSAGLIKEQLDSVLGVSLQRNTFFP